MGGGLYAVAMAKGFPVLWVHTRGLADVPIQSTRSSCEGDAHPGKGMRFAAG